MRGKDSAGRKTISLKTTQSFGNNPCKQGVPYKEPQKIRFCAMQNRLMACWDGGRFPMKQAAASHTTRRDAVGFTPPDTAIYTPASRISSLCLCPFSGRISAFFFVLRGLHRRGRGLTRAPGLKGLPSKKQGLTQGRVPDH